MDQCSIHRLVKILACRQRLLCSFSCKSLQHFSSHAEGLGEHLSWAKGGGLVHKLAAIDPSAIVEIGAIIHDRAQLGPHSHIGSGSVVGPGVRIGSNSTLGYNVSLQNCCVGDHCIIHAGVCIGQDGFGFFVDDQGNMMKKPQMLEVYIGNNVEIGAHCCIDRGSWRNTTIGDHTKIDNLVQVGHNVVIGRSCMICGQVGLGGSSTVGDFVVIGGKAGVADHISIASKINAMLIDIEEILVIKADKQPDYRMIERQSTDGKKGKEIGRNVQRRIPNGSC